MTIKFLQLNLWHGLLLDNALTFIKKERPDIINFQEIFDGPDAYAQKGKPYYYGTLAALKQALTDWPHVAYAPAFIDNRPEGLQVSWGLATFSRFPIVAERTVFFDRPFRTDFSENEMDPAECPRNLLHCAIDCNGKRIHTGNVHGIWGTDGADNRRRLAMAETVLTELEPYTPLILSGDFNVDEPTETIGQLAGKWRNVFAGELSTSFNLRHKSGGGFATSVVDFMFVSEQWHIAHHATSDADVSDHLPLLATLSL